MTSHVGRPAAPEETPERQWIGISAAFLLSAGILHLVLAPEHLQHARGQGLFFIGLGILQVAGAVLIQVRPTAPVLAGAIVGLAAMPVTVYLLTRFIAAPFTDEAEPFDLLGLATIGTELAALVALAWVVGQRGVAWDRPHLAPTALLAVLVALGAVAGVAVHVVGTATESISWLAEGEDHEHGLDQPMEGDGHDHAQAADSPVPERGLGPAPGERGRLAVLVGA